MSASPAGAAAGGEVTAAVHNQVCGETYCYCVKDGWDEQLCRDNYCKGGPWWDGKDVECDVKPDGPTCDPGYCPCVDAGRPEWECRAAHCGGKTPDVMCSGKPGSSGQVCGETYCYCVKDGWDEQLCRDNYCKGGPWWDGKDVECDVKPEEPKCDPGYCECVDLGAVPEPTCRQLYCNGHTPDIPCAVTPKCKNPQKDSTASPFLSSRTTPSSAPRKPWADVHDATDPDADGASVILQPNERSDFLVLHNAARMSFPANAERILSVRVHFQAKASPGYSAYTGEARLIQSGSCDDPVEQTIYSHDPYGRYSFSNGGSGTVWGGPGGGSTLSVEDFQAPGFGVCFRARATQGLTRAAVDSAYVSVTYETCDP